jgi:hypothetical protein
VVDWADAGTDAGLAFDAGPPEPAALAFRLAVVSLDGGLAVFDDAFDGGVRVEPARALELSSPVGLSGVRVRLLDGDDAVVPSDDTLETSDAGFRYRIELAQPLKTGRSYSVLVDAETADVFTDTFGRSSAEWRLPLRVLGEVQPEPGATSKKAKKKRR